MITPFVYRQGILILLIGKTTAFSSRLQQIASIFRTVFIRFATKF